MLPDLAVLAAVYLLALLPRWRGLGHCVLAVRTVFFIYLVCVLGVTLLPVLANLPKLAGNHYALMELEPFRDLRNGYGNAARQLSLNVVMTVPFGFLWPLVRRKRGLCRAEPVHRAVAAASDDKSHIRHHGCHRQHGWWTGGVSAVPALWFPPPASLRRGRSSAKCGRNAGECGRCEEWRRRKSG